MLFSYLTYLFQLLLINGIFTLLIFTLFNKNSKDKVLLLLTSLGISPIITSLITFYLLLLLPHKTSIFYILFIVSFYLLLFLIKRKEIPETLKIIKNIILSCNKYFLAILLMLIIVWQFTIIKIPILGHDTFEYATQGKIFFTNKIITYKEQPFDSITNFFYKGLHGYGYPLFNTIERFFNDIFSLHQRDYFFKSISGYYWILIVLLQYYLLSKKNKILAILSTITLISSFGFTIMFAFYHLDTLRIFLLMLSTIYLLKSIDSSNNFCLALFGITAGLSAFSHSINCLLNIIQIFTFFLFQKHFKQKLYKTIFIIVLFILFGGIHYILDTFLGAGWIVK